MNHENDSHFEAFTDDPVRKIEATEAQENESRDNQAMDERASDRPGFSRAWALLSEQNAILERIALHQPLSLVLEAIARLTEAYLPDTRASLLLVEPATMTLRYGAGPSLPAGFHAAIDGMAVREGGSVCGTAAYRKQPVVVADTLTDPLTADFLDLVRRYQILAAWSSPIISAQAEVLGTFAIYYQTRHVPTEREQEVLNIVTYLARVAIEHDHLQADLRQSEAALRESERRLHAALQAGNIGIWEWDLRTDTIWWAAETERLYGLEPGTFEGTYEAYRRFMYPEDQEMAHRNRERAVEQKTPLEHEYRILLPDGSLRWLMSKGNTLYDQADRPVRMLGTVTDITERKRVEAQFIQAQKMEGIGRLAGGIAHDFNNLLTIILGYAEMVERELAPESKMSAKMQHIQKAATRAATLTSQLLAFARRQVGTMKALNPNEVIASLVQIIRPVLGDNIALETLLEEEAGNILADPSQIEQILIALVLNARDAMPYGGKLTLQTKNVHVTGLDFQQTIAMIPGRYVLMIVSDTGLGMSAEVKGRLFEPFFTTKDVGKGAGLGMATVYGIVKQAGGYVFVSSEISVGTTVEVYLLRAEALSESEAEVKFF